MHELPPIWQVDAEVSTTASFSNTQGLVRVVLERDIARAAFLSEDVSDSVLELVRDWYDLDVCVATFGAESPDLEADCRSPVLRVHRA